MHLLMENDACVRPQFSVEKARYIAEDLDRPEVQLLKVRT
jgi:hypothetical protein